jgi:uncharacterized membrane protein YhdT
MKNRRFRQADREALITLGLYGLFFLWWTLFAFGLGGGDPEHYSYVFGMPSWFFYSCVLGCPVLTFLLWLAIRLGFSHMSLEARADDNQAQVHDISLDALPKEGTAGQTLKKPAPLSAGAVSGEGD